MPKCTQKLVIGCVGLAASFPGLAHILGQFSAKEETASVASIASGKIASGYGFGDGCDI